MEVWKNIVGYNGRYRVSNRGRVWSAYKNDVLMPNRMTHGYVCVHLYAGGKSNRKVVTIHKLVATAFIDNPQKLREVNHKDFDRENNHVSNLEWVSRAQNVQHAIDGGRKPKTEKAVYGISLRSKNIVRFDSQTAAEIHLRGKQTGRVSQALAKNTPAYGYVWWLA